jgi:hypothetical protein
MRDATLVSELKPGTPIQVIGHEKDLAKTYGAAPEQAVFVGLLDHYKPGLVFVQLNALYDKEFRPLTVSLPLEARAFRQLSGQPAAKLQQAALGHERRNIGDRLGAASIGMSLGTDPEVFVVDETGEVIPAWEFAPKKGKGNGQCYWDGFQAEFTVHAGNCLALMADSLQKGLAQTLQTARKQFPKAKLSLDNVLEVSPQVLKACKDEHAALGCDPSENIYGAKGKAVLDGRKLPMRFAGGHMHFGVGRQMPKTTEAIVKTLDAIVGVSGVSLAAGIDSAVRRQFYGLAGEYRLPAHGIEWRTLSNFWLTHPGIMHLVFDLGRECVRLGHGGLRYLWEADEQEVQDIINGNDVQAARKLLDRNKDMLYGVFRHIYNNGHGGTMYSISCEDVAKAAVRTVMNGVEVAVADPKDIEKNWHLAGGWVGHSAAKGAQWGMLAATMHAGKKA